MPTPTRVPDLLRARSDAEPEAVALVVDGGSSLTYAEWDQRSNAAARALVAAGVGSGDRVALFFDNAHRADYAVAYVAVHKSAAVAVPISPRFAAPELAHILDHSGLLVCPRDLLPRSAPPGSPIPTSSRRDRAATSRAPGRLTARRSRRPGRLDESGTYSGSCREGTGQGTLTLTLPTADGERTFVFTDAVEWTGTLGRFQSDVLSGTFQLVATEGDCVTAPVTKAHLVAQGVLQG